MSPMSNPARTPDHPIDPLFLERWSPRAFTEQRLTEADLMPLFEAARWAASSFNAQPWRFIYALRGEAPWDTAVTWLLPMNAAWAKNSAALVFVLSETRARHPVSGEIVDSPTHSFDAGAACGYFSLQATRNGLSTHFMAGIDRTRIRAEAGVPADVHIECAAAVGRRGDAAGLPEPYRGREGPSGRKPVSAFVTALDKPNQPR